MHDPERALERVRNMEAGIEAVRLVIQEAMREYGEATSLCQTDHDHELHYCERYNGELRDAAYRLAVVQEHLEVARFNAGKVIAIRGEWQ